MSEVFGVAKKKSPQKGGPESWGRKPLVANFRGSAGFRDWLKALSRYDRQSIAGVIERALVHYAREIGFAKEAPER